MTIKIVPNKDRLYAENRTKRGTFEALAFQIVHEYDVSYFHGAAHVTAVKLTHFEHDYRAEGAFITFGMFDSESNTISINRHIRDVVDLGLGNLELQAVLWHELCHAVLINAHQSLRHGRYHPSGGDHGPDFERLVNAHPVMAKVLAEGLHARLVMRIAARMHLDKNKIAAWREQHKRS